MNKTYHFSNETIKLIVTIIIVVLLERRHSPRTHKTNIIIQIYNEKETKGHTYIHTTTINLGSIVVQLTHNRKKTSEGSCNFLPPCTKRIRIAPAA